MRAGKFSLATRLCRKVEAPPVPHRGHATDIQEDAVRVPVSVVGGCWEPWSSRLVRSGVVFRPAFPLFLFPWRRATTQEPIFQPGIPSPVVQEYGMIWPWLLVGWLFPYGFLSLSYCGSDVFLLSFRPFSPLSDDAHAPCHRFCLTQYLPHDYYYLHHDQQDLGGKSCNFPAALALGACLLLRDQLAWIARGRPCCKLCRASELP